MTSAERVFGHSTGAKLNKLTMKLVIEIGETSDALGTVTQCFIRPSSDEKKLGQNLFNFSLANQVARLTEVAQEIKKAVNAYYSKDVDMRPRVRVQNDTTPKADLSSSNESRVRII